MRAIILRGLPGSGKSTWIRHCAPEARVVSADNFFVRDGVYRYDPRRIGEAHADCLCRFIRALQAREPLVVVDNTNVQLWEFCHYKILAEELGYNVEVVIVGERSLQACDLYAGRNTHNVPVATIKAMALRWEDS